MDILEVEDEQSHFFVLNQFVSSRFSEPGSAPRRVQVRPLSSTTALIQWDEPETPNGQVTVSIVYII